MICATVPGRAYRVQVRDESTGEWSDTGESATASGPTLTFTIAAQEPKTFYRVRTAP